MNEVCDGWQLGSSSINSRGAVRYSSSPNFGKGADDEAAISWRPRMKATRYILPRVQSGRLPQ